MSLDLMGLQLCSDVCSFRLFRLTAVCFFQLSVLTMYTLLLLGEMN